MSGTDQAKDLIDFAAKASEVVRQIEELNRTANSEAGFAFNAKKMAEEHASSIAQVKGSVEADFSWLTTTKKNAEEIHAAITASKATIDADLALIAEARLNAKADSAAIKAVSEETVPFVDAIDGANEKAAEGEKKISEALAVVERAQGICSTAQEAIQTTQTAIGELAEATKESAREVEDVHEEAKKLLNALSSAVKTAVDTDAKVKSYEARLSAQTKAFQALNEKIESNLPGATSAGLASAFRLQKERFIAPARGWLFLLVLSLTVLFVLGFRDLPVDTTLDGIFRQFLNRLPIIAPLVWLAIYAGRHYSLALRLQEEYAFKEALSFAFEGYKREMATITTEEGKVSPLVTLCENVLSSLAQRPGRIYEGKHDDVTLMTPAKETVEAAIGAARGDKTTA